MLIFTGKKHRFQLCPQHERAFRAVLECAERQPADERPKFWRVVDSFADTVEEMQTPTEMAARV
jgi:hypothetical protein